MPKPRRRKTPPKGKLVPRFSLLFPIQFVCIFTNRRLKKETWTVTTESPGTVRGCHVDEGKHLSIKDFENSLNLLQILIWRAAENTARFNSLDENDDGWFWMTLFYHIPIKTSRITQSGIIFSISKEMWNHFLGHNSIPAELVPLHLHTEAEMQTATTAGRF